MVNAFLKYPLPTRIGSCVCCCFLMKLAFWELSLFCSILRHISMLPTSTRRLTFSGEGLYRDDGRVDLRSSGGIPHREEEA
jgi:hypothetical protein